MNILNVSQNYFITGGSDRYFFDIEFLLKSKGHNVIPFVCANPKNLDSKWSKYFPSGADFDNPSFKDFAKYIYNWDAKKRLSSLLDSVEIDIVHLNIYYGKITSSILSEFVKRNIPVVQTLHEYKIVCPVYTCYRNESSCNACQGGKFFNAIVHRCKKNSLARSVLSATESYISHFFGAVSCIDKFICISDFLKNKHISMGIDPLKLKTVHNFVSEASFIKSTQKSDYIVFAGRIEKLKGIDVIVELAKMLPKERFVIAGTGDYLESFKKMIEVNELSNIEVLGFVPKEKLVGILAHARISLVPSLWEEPFGLSVVESLAVGTPVVAYAVGGITELIEHKVDGYLASAQNFDDFLNGIRFILGLGENYLKMSTAAFQKAYHKFHPDVYYDNLINTYESAISDRRTLKVGQ